MQKYTFKEHFIELKKRFILIVCCFMIFFTISYLFKENIYDFFLKPLVDLSTNTDRKIIYTGLTEAFFSYIKLSIFVSFAATIPFICYQVYAFISPGLHVFEKRIVLTLLVFSPILFYCGGFFVFYIVMPRAWDFFLSYENNNMSLPLVMEARISEYLNLVMQLTMAFGAAFQLPIIMVILGIVGIVNSTGLKKQRRVAIVVIFIVAAIFTPPDVISQIALAIPLLILYEVSIMLCKLVENRGLKEC
ncbi:MAG: twin-arginine translocase subunit TatC [Rickettsiaceae bacterium]|nr:twin-arginine translocase subunit TatC [Rickettsiaceae bacterium]MDP4832618.1 twin-arginine translocase subunit TatC [Rickettsiaceae bacterium]MDP5021240.1 twin-arginine translocase subunit TatC [Rickettsiaceae bacterium]MDP5083185.1 twin-arginine translocase subunit TatC [Rickettsiaceae bacterium]